MTEPKPRRRRRVKKAVTPRLRILLLVVLGLFALLSVGALYLAAITLAEHLSGEVYQNYFYQLMFLLHLVLGLALVVPALVFAAVHLARTWRRPNRNAVRAGYGLLATILVLLFTGLVLVRIEGIIDLRDPDLRRIAYWGHVLSPLLVIWLFVLHRLAGPRIRWRGGGRIAVVGVAFAALMLVVQSRDPRAWGRVGPESGEQYFFPSLARTATGDFIPARSLMMDRYCQECHGDIHDSWAVSAHRFASFNNPAYLFSVRGTREAMMARDGNVQGSRFCAGCHDLVPFFSGAFDDPEFDDVNHPTAQAGITCTGCHAITNINSVRGNADYTIDEPLHYPFTFSENRALKWVNRQLIKAKPEFHKKTFLKPLHRTTEFCGSCHKVHLPRELNHYRWLRGQNHFDAFLLSGVSGIGVTSFYYPEKAETSCNGCHMPTLESDDFGARRLDDTALLKVHDHQFPSANTGVPHLLGLGEEVIQAHRDFNEGVMRVDLFGLREGGSLEGELMGPLKGEEPAELLRGRSYLVETVIRTLKMGHLFTQGTADSNQVWLDVEIRAGDRVLGRSGAMDAGGVVDPWSHFVNAYVLDKHGRRIDRRNAEDIFVALYNNQIPPGAADTVHYGFTVPADAEGPLTIEATLKYRKFDTTYMRLVQDDPEWVNDLPVLVLASDRVELPLAGGPAAGAGEDPFPVWTRWNDAGIGHLRNGEFRQAEEAFRQVEALGRADGPVNLARVYLEEGRLDEAVAALERAAAFDPPAYPWTVAWLSGRTNLENGHLDAAIENLRSLAETAFPEARARGFDFSRDYRMLNMLGQALFERSKVERGEAGRATRELFLGEAVKVFTRALQLDPENATAHHNLSLLYDRLGEGEQAAEHRSLHAKYKTDDNARDRAVAAARAVSPAADHAAEQTVIYDLQRPGAFGLPRGRGRELAKVAPERRSEERG